MGVACTTQNDVVVRDSEERGSPTSLPAESLARSSNSISDEKSPTATLSESPLQVNYASTFYKLPSEVVANIIMFLLHDEKQPPPTAMDWVVEQKSKSVITMFILLGNKFIDAVVFDDYLWKQVKPHDTFNYSSSSSAYPAYERLLCARLNFEKNLLCRCTLGDAQRLVGIGVPLQSIHVSLAESRFSGRSRYESSAALYVLRRVLDVRFSHMLPELLTELCSVATQIDHNSYDGGCCEDKEPFEVIGGNSWSSSGVETEEGDEDQQQQKKVKGVNVKGDGHDKVVEEVVRITSSNTATEKPLLDPLLSITSISMWSNSGDPLVLSHPLPNLRQLSLNDAHQFTPDEKLHAFFRMVPNLRCLSTGRGSRPFDLAGFAKALPLLEELHLCSAGHLSAGALLELQHLKVLTINDDCVRYFYEALLAKGVEVRLLGAYKYPEFMWSLDPSK